MRNIIKVGVCDKLLSHHLSKFNRQQMISSIVQEIRGFEKNFYNSKVLFIALNSPYKIKTALITFLKTCGHYQSESTCVLIVLSASDGRWPSLSDKA